MTKKICFLNFFRHHNCSCPEQPQSIVNCHCVLSLITYIYLIVKSYKDLTNAGEKFVALFCFVFSVFF